MATTLGLEDMYFNWRTVSDVDRYVKVVNKLKERPSCSEGNAGALRSNLRKTDGPVQMYWTDNNHTTETKRQAHHWLEGGQ